MVLEVEETVAAAATKPRCSRCYPHHSWCCPVQTVQSCEQQVNASSHWLKMHAMKVYCGRGMAQQHTLRS